MGLGILSALVLQWKLYQSIATLPKQWKKNMPMRNFQLGVFFLVVFLVSSLVFGSISDYLAKHCIYNSFMFSIDFTVSTPFLFGFLFINTQRRWKKYVYFILYAIIVGYLINGRYYDPHCVLPGSASLLIFSLHFLAALLHLTDLLLNPKSTHFNFQLKINLTILIYALASVILTSFNWEETQVMNVSYSKLISYLNIIINYLFYISFALIFLNESFKLRRNPSKSLTK